MKSDFYWVLGLGFLCGGILIFALPKQGPSFSRGGEEKALLHELGYGKKQLETAAHVNDGQVPAAEPSDAHFATRRRTIAAEVSEKRRVQEEEIQKLQARLQQIRAENLSLVEDFRSCMILLLKGDTEDGIWKGLESYLETIQDPEVLTDLPMLVTEMTPLLGKGVSGAEGLYPNQAKELFDLTKQVIEERNELQRKPPLDFGKNPLGCYRSLYRKHDLAMARILSPAQYDRWLLTYPPPEKAPTPDFYCQHQH